MANSTEPRDNTGKRPLDYSLGSLIVETNVSQQRNKPKEPPKPPPKAPFFLPTLPGIEHRFDIPTPESKGKDGKRPTRRLDAMAAGIDSEFHKALVSGNPDEDCERMGSCCDCGCC